MKKKLSLITGAIIILICLIFFYLKFRKLDDFNPLIKEKIQSLVKDGSDGLYSIEFDTLHADVVNSTLMLNDVRLIPDTLLVATLDSQGRRPADVLNVFVSSIAVSGINISDFVSGKKIDLEALTINGATLEIFHKTNHNQTKEKDTASIQTLYQRLSKQVDRLSIKELSLTNMKFVHHNFISAEKEKELTFNKVNIHFGSILVDSTTQYDSSRFLYAENATIAAGKFKMPTGDSLYYIGMDSLSINALKKDLIVYNFSIEPRGNKAEFSKKLSFVKERNDLFFKEVMFKQIDWWNIISTESFSAREAILKDGKFDIYKDKSLPEFTGSKMGKYPQQQLMKIPFPIDIDTIKVENLDLSYEELNPKSGLRATLLFNNIVGTITNITNNKENIAANKTMKADAECSFMNNANFKASFTFDLAKAKEGQFLVNAQLGKLAVASINPVFEKLGLFKIEKGTINGISLNLAGNNNVCHGTVKFLYDDLKINVLAKGNDEGKQKKRGLLSFIANTFVLKNSNPAGDGKIRVEDVSLERDVRKNFFGLIWKTIQKALTKTVS